MPQDYYIILTTGVVSKVADVTETPTIVDKDMKQGVYRDLLQNFPYSPLAGYAYQGPGWSMYPTYSGSPLELTAWTTVQDDILTHEPPRSLTWPESHWLFKTANGDYFTPTRFVASMSTDQPTI